MNTLQFSATGTNTPHRIVLFSMHVYVHLSGVYTPLHVCAVFACAFDRKESKRQWALIKIDGGNQSAEQLATAEWAEGVRRVLPCASVSDLLVNMVIVHLSLHVDMEQKSYAVQPWGPCLIYHSQTGFL